MRLHVCEVCFQAAGKAFDQLLSSENICSRIALIVVFVGIAALLVENLLMSFPQLSIAIFCPVHRSLTVSIEITFLVVDVGQALFQK